MTDPRLAQNLDSRTDARTDQNPDPPIHEDIVSPQDTPPQDSLTAVEYLQNQLELERKARELMPYEPDACTYPRPLRQLVYACLTCLKANDSCPVGVCYLCLIQCHSTHELVELFSKRNFVCDCGTTKMAQGTACSLRTGYIGPSKPRLRTGSLSELFSYKTRPRLPADDIPSLENTYNHNFHGRFCLCRVLYDPENESRTMHQCFFGEVCGEDWYHQECILGPETGDKDLDEGSKFPDLDSFSEFICWKCVSSYKLEFDELCKIPGLIQWRFVRSSEPERKRPRKEVEKLELKNLNNLDLINLNNLTSSDTSEPYSILFTPDFQEKLGKIKPSLDPKNPLSTLLNSYEFLVDDIPIYQPPKEEMSSPETSSSLYELGTNALLALPVPQAIEGIEAYDAMREKLRGFFKGFVEKNKVVTEEEVRDFFGKLREEK